MIGSIQLFMHGRQMFLFKIILGAALLLFILAQSSGADSDLKPGDMIGPHNWQRVHGMVGENLLHRIKEGYSFKIKEGHSIGPPKEYVLATKRYSDKVRLSANGELLNYVAGQPFADVNLKDPLVAQKLIWNFYWRWIGDDYKTGGGTGEG